MACRGMDFHFWDAVDDLSKTDIDLVFDDQRLYMHNASGLFGSVPLTLSGECGWAVLLFALLFARFFKQRLLALLPS